MLSSALVRDKPRLGPCRVLILVFIPEVDVIVMKKNHANVWIVPTCTWTPIGIITYIIDNQTFLYIKLVVLKNIIEDDQQNDHVSIVIVQ